MTGSSEERIRRILESAQAAGRIPGAVCSLAMEGTTQFVVPVGVIATYGDGGEPLSVQREVEPGTLYDLASITKVFTAVTILTMVDDGIIGLDDCAARWLPEFFEGRKAEVTVRQLLTHTSGLPGSWHGWHDLLEGEGTGQVRYRAARRPEVLHDILLTELDAEPGTHFEYSCIGYNTLMAIGEAATELGWEDLVRERVLDPLDLDGITFRPEQDRCAPTEYEPAIARGMVRGIVHDEGAWALGGVAGNAGLFSGASDLLRFGEVLRAGFPGILSGATAAALWTDQLPAVLGPGRLARGAGPAFGQGLGPRIGQADFMSEAFPEARGHTGFTGTSLMIDRERQLSLVLLTNRVHPSRDAEGINDLRAAVAAELSAG